MSGFLAFVRYLSPTPQRAHQLPHRTGNDINGGEQEDHHLGLRNHQEGEEEKEKSRNSENNVRELKNERNSAEKELKVIKKSLEGDD